MEMLGRRAAWASLTRLNAAATRFSAAMMSGRRSSNSDGSPAGTSEARLPELRRHADLGAGIPAEEQLERAQRLLVGQLHLPQAVSVGLQGHARRRDVEFVADADPQPLLREIEQLGRRHRPLP